MTHGTLIVGIGSPHGDDRAGWELVKALEDVLVNPTCQLRIAQSPIEILSWLDDLDRLILCDACRTGGNVGDVHRFRWPDPQLAKTRWSGTHDFSVVATIELAERLARLPDEVICVAVEAAVANPTSGMSPEVSNAIGRMAQLVAEEVTTIDASTSEMKSCTNSR